MSFLHISDVRQKIKMVEAHSQEVLEGRLGDARVPAWPARDLQVVSVSERPPKMGIGTIEGRQKLLHDLANIELQAMELGFRTLIEFPDAPSTFRRDLRQIVLDESRHLEMCLNLLETLGGAWGKWPVHLGLWAAVQRTDTLLERIFIVHRYLESSGLDAGEMILRRLSGVGDPQVRAVVQAIVDDEISHVEFGSRWFRFFCEKENMEPMKTYSEWTAELLVKNPRPGAVSETLRRQAGYTPEEVACLLRQKNQIYGGA